MNRSASLFRSFASHRPRLRRWCTLLVVVLACQGLGCDTIFPECDGAPGLRLPEANALACAGWLEFVEDNVGQIAYVDVVRLEGSNDASGRAYCRSCRVEVATLRQETEPPFAVVPRDSVELASILVHEAAHLEDACDHGEAPAEAAEAAFLDDFIERCMTR